MTEHVALTIYAMTAEDLPDQASWPSPVAEHALRHARGLANLTWHDGSPNDSSMLDTIMESAVEVGNTYGQDGVTRRISDPLVAYYAANCALGVRAAIDEHRDYLKRREQPVDEKNLGRITLIFANLHADNIARDYYEAVGNVPPTILDNRLMTRREDVRESLSRHLNNRDYLT